MKKNLLKLVFLCLFAFVLGSAIINAVEYETRTCTGNYVTYDSQKAAMKITATVGITSSDEYISSSNGQYVRVITNPSYAIVAVTEPTRGTYNAHLVTWAGTVSFKRAGKTYSTQTCSATLTV